jgi:serine/threonine-protein kinase
MRSLKLVALALALLVPTTAFAAGRRDRHDHHDRRDRQDYVAPAPVIDPGTFGAIAYSPSTGKIGWSYGFSDGEAAKAGAVSACGVGDCAWQVMEGNEYAVLATGSGGPAVAWNADYTTAQNDALAACSAKGDNCVVNAWVFK